MSKENEALIRRWFEEVWNKGRVEAIDEMFAADGIAHGLSDDIDNPIRGTAGFKVFHHNFRNAFPDINVRVVDTVAEGDKIAARCEVNGTHTGDHLGFAATKKPVRLSGMTLCRIENGKIQESWNNFDFLSLYKQLDAITLPGS